MEIDREHTGSVLKIALSPESLTPFQPACRRPARPSAAGSGDTGVRSESSKVLVAHTAAYSAFHSGSETFPQRVPQHFWVCVYGAVRPVTPKWHVAAASWSPSHALHCRGVGEAASPAETAGPGQHGVQCLGRGLARSLSVTLILRAFSSHRPTPAVSQRT